MKKLLLLIAGIVLLPLALSAQIHQVGLRLGRTVMRHGSLETFGSAEVDYMQSHSLGEQLYYSWQSSGGLGVECGLDHYGRKFGSHTYGLLDASEVVNSSSHIWSLNVVLQYNLLRAIHVDKRFSLNAGLTAGGANARSRVGIEGSSFGTFFSHRYQQNDLAVYTGPVVSASARIFRQYCLSASWSLQRVFSPDASTPSRPPLITERISVLGGIAYEF